MKTVGTVINTIVVVSGMLCSLVAGAFVGYSMAKDEKSRYMNRRSYTTYSNAYNYNVEYNKGYANGWKECKEAYGDDEKEESKDEDI